MSGRRKWFILGALAVLAAEAAIMILLPVLVPARAGSPDSGNRVRCALDLKIIGQAIQLYRNENNAAYPPDLPTLVKNEPLTADIFICPSTKTHLPQYFPAQHSAEWVNIHSDYLYICPIGYVTPPADSVIIYEKNSNHGGDGMNILFADDSVQFYDLPMAHEEIERTKKAIALQSAASTQP